MYIYIFVLFTLNPSSPGFSGSKSYNARQHGFLCPSDGDFAGDLHGDGMGETETITIFVIFQIPQY